MEFCSCARGRQWCGIIHYHWWTASMKPRLLFSRASYASWGLSLSSVYFFFMFSPSVYFCDLFTQKRRSKKKYGNKVYTFYQKRFNLNSIFVLIIRPRLLSLLPFSLEKAFLFHKLYIFGKFYSLLNVCTKCKYLLNVRLKQFYLFYT